MPKSTNTADEYDIISHDETALSPKVLAQITEWLRPTDYLAESGEFRRHLSSQAPGTGLWVCETEEYRKWHDSPDHGSLWIKGVPGAGKSVTAASIIQHLQATEDCPVLFFFFRNIVAANFSPRALIQDWLAQLLPYSPKLQFALESRLQTKIDETSDGDLIQLFLDGVSTVPKVYCFADALDEMSSDNRLFLQHLNGLATYRPRSVKLLITSRPKQYLQSALRDSSIVHISLQQKLVDADIVSYLSYRFDTAQKSDAQRQRKKQVVHMVAKRSQSLFLYAKLTMDQVEAALLSDNLVDIPILERSLPVGLEQIYASVLAKQREELGISLDIQLLVLEAVTHAARPLRLNELTALAKFVYPDAAGPKAFKRMIATSCGPLVEILEDETLQVIHHSFTEFLRGDTRSASSDTGFSGTFPTIDSDQAHKRLASYSLQYLQSGSLLRAEERSGEVDLDPSITYVLPQFMVDRDREHYERSYLGIPQEPDPFEYQEASLLYPFLNYAVENWAYHASRYDVRDEEFFDTVREFLNPDSLAFRRWLVLQWGSTSKTRESPEGIPTALHISAFSGMVELVSKLIEEGASHSERDAQDRVPLHWAAANGHTNVVSLLLKHGADPNPWDGRGLKPIHLAALRNHASVVKVLLEAGVEPDTIKTSEDHAGRLLGGERVTFGECAVLYASERGHTESIVTMIPFCKPEVLERMVCECCRFNRTDTVLAILRESDVSPDATYRGATALYFACSLLNTKCVEALIKRGADVCKMSHWSPPRVINGPTPSTEIGKAPLHRILAQWYQKTDSTCRDILRLLIKAGADLEQADGVGDTPLLIAAGCKVANGREPPYLASLQAVKVLVEAGADIKRVHTSGDAVLNILLSNTCDLDTVKLLVEHGSDPNKAGGRSGQTALHCVLDTRNCYRKAKEDVIAVIHYLLEEGADPNLRDSYGESLVYRAMLGGSEVFPLLLSKCTDMSVKKKCWFALSGLGEKKFRQYIDLLLAEGIDIDTRRSDGRTLFLLSVQSEWMRRELVKYGARSDAVDNHGNNALHILAWASSLGGNEKRMERLMKETGLDPLSTNNNGDTLLHLIAREYNTEPKVAEYARWLLSIGVPLNTVNKDGCTALHVEQRKGPIGSTLHNVHKRIPFVDAINIDKNLDFEIRDKHGLSALHVAAMKSGIELATLVAAGADIAFFTADSQNVLHLSCRARLPNIVGQILDDPGFIDLDQKDSFGRTPLHYACSSGDPESVALLLNQGADVHVVDNAGRTPLHACAEFKAEQGIWDAHVQGEPWLRGPTGDPNRPAASHSPYSSYRPWYRTYGEPTPNIRPTFFPGVSAIVKLLLEAGCDPAVADKKHFTALDIALQWGCAEFAQVFVEDHQLFIKVTAGLEQSEKTSKNIERTRRYMMTQMTLMQPRPCLPMVGQNEAVRDEVLRDPCAYLPLLTTEDVVKVISEGFNATADNSTPYYPLLEKLLHPGYGHILEKSPTLALYYSSYDTVADRLKAEKQKRTYVGEGSTIFTALQLACRSKKPNMQTVKMLVEKVQVDVNAPCATVSRFGHDAGQVVPGGNALHLLAQANNRWEVEAMRYLIEKGADIEVKDEYGRTPLHIAACGKSFGSYPGEISGFWRIAMVRLLIARGADLNVLDKEDKSPLHKASAAPDALKELLRVGADMSVGARSPLFQAISDQNLAALEAFLDHGADVNSLDAKRHSRDLHYSLKKSRKLYALVCAGIAPNINASVSNSVPLLHCLVERGADLYLPLNDTETLVHFLFEYTEYETVDALMREPCVSRIDFNCRDQQGRTVLMAAGDWRHILPGYSYRHWSAKAIGIPLRMLDHGADPTLVDNEGMTALHYLLRNPGIPDDVILQFVDRKEVAPILLAKDKNGYSPFHFALGILRPKVCEALLAKGANLLEPDPKGLTAMHYIAKHCLESSRRPRGEGHISNDLPDDYFDQCLGLWNRFVSGGGSINAADNRGNTPLHEYLGSPKKDSYKYTTLCHADFFDKLFPTDSGVDLLAVNNEGETALHMVARRPRSTGVMKGHEKALFQMLMSKGLDPLKEDAKGRSALDVASACEQDDIVELLRRK